MRFNFSYNYLAFNVLSIVLHFLIFLEVFLNQRSVYLICTAFFGIFLTPASQFYLYELLPHIRSKKGNFATRF